MTSEVVTNKIDEFSYILLYQFHSYTSWESKIHKPLEKVDINDFDRYTPASDICGYQYRSVFGLEFR